MRLSLLTVLILTSSISSAQFIPQPAGYNPDENADGIIGVSDLAGILSLYGSAFNSENCRLCLWDLCHQFLRYVLHLQVGGSYDCETRAWDNYPIAPLVLPEADVYQIHVLTLWTMMLHGGRMVLPITEVEASLQRYLLRLDSKR